MKKKTITFIAGLILLLLGVLASNHFNANSTGAHSLTERKVINEDPTALAQAELPLKDQIAKWIVEQGQREEYYLEGLSYVEVQLDTDSELEIIAGIDGGVHLGQFFVFDSGADGEYKLIAEKDWKVEQLHPGMVKDVELKMIFETVDRTGGTGVDVYEAHLWHLDNGEFKEVWNGWLKGRNAMIAGSHSLLAGSYQVIDGWLYNWETVVKLEDDDVTQKEPPQTTLKVYSFNGEMFELVESKELAEADNKAVN